MISLKNQIISWKVSGNVVGLSIPAMWNSTPVIKT